MRLVTTARRHAAYTLDEYLELEAYANVKHEFFDGQIYAMAGGTPEHGAMAMRLGAALVSQLTGRRCNVYSSDVRIRVSATGLDTYPDLSVVCGKEERDARDRNALINPIVLVEVLSPSTAEYDRGDKLDHYKQIPSLREVVLLHHDRAEIEIWRRGDDSERWTQHHSAVGETANLAAIDCSLVVDELYRDPLA